MLVVSIEDLGCVSSVKDVEFVFLEGQMGWQHAVKSGSERHDDRAGVRRFGNSPLAVSSGHAVGRKEAELGVIGLMRAGCGQDRDAISGGSRGQHCEVRHDFGGSWDEERTAGVHEIALGINVEKYERAFEHGSSPRIKVAACWVWLQATVSRIADWHDERLTTDQRSAYNRVGFPN